MRLVFDTNVVLSTLLFRKGRLAWLRDHWSDGQSTALLSHATASELTRVISLPKFRLDEENRIELLAFYLPHCELIEVSSTCPIICRDTADQPFLDLAHSGAADILVTGDADLLSLAAKTTFAIETPETYRLRFSGSLR